MEGKSVPAAAVIPAPIAYINVVAVKKLVVGFLVWRARVVSIIRCDCGAFRPSFAEIASALD